MQRDFGSSTRSRRSKSSWSNLSSLDAKRQRGNLLGRSLRFEPLEDRTLLSLTVNVGAGAPVLVAFQDATATASTTYEPTSSNTGVAATVLNTSEMLKMQVHFVNAEGETVSGEMDFLLLDDYAPNNIKHVADLIDQGFYDGLTFHRIIQDSMSQGGDPSGDGTGGSGTGSVDDEFNADIRFTSDGLLALANSGTDTNDCQFFITNGSQRFLDYRHVVLGKIVVGSSIAEELNNVTVDGETPIDTAIIDSVSIVSSTGYGLLMLEASSDATGSTLLAIGASDGSNVTMIGEDGQTDILLEATVVADTPSIDDRPAFLGTIDDITTTIDTPITIAIPAVEGDAGVALAYSGETSDETNIAISVSGSDATDGSATITPGNGVAGLFGVTLKVARDGSEGNTAPDSQTVPLWIRPTVPTGLELGTIDDSGITFHVTGVSAGIVVAIFMDGGSSSITDATATGDTIDITVDMASLTSGLHTFTVRQAVHYDATTIGNRAIDAGFLFSDAASTTVTIPSVGIGAPILVAFNDSAATSTTTYTASSTNSDLTATVLNTSMMLKMQVSYVNAEGETVSGEMDFLLFDDYAPNNIQHLIDLANSGFYDGLTFHRIIQDFMIQGGDPLGTGSGSSGTGKVDDEFNADMRFDSNGLLALANSGTDTNDCQFFITDGSQRFLDYQYVIIGKIVAGADVQQALASIPVEDNGNNETSKPVNAPVINSVSIVSSVGYGLVMLKAETGATNGEAADVTVTASDGSTVNLTTDDGISQETLTTYIVTDTPSTSDRPAFLGTISDVTTTMNTPVTVAIPVVQGDAGVALAYGAGTVAEVSNLTITASGTNATNGSVTVTPSGNIVGLYSLGVGVKRSSTDTSANTNFDVQYVPLWIRPLAPTAFSVTTTGVTNGGTTTINSGFTFHVTGVLSGLTVSIYVDGGATPFGYATASGSTVDVHTTGQLTNGSHTFTVKQSVAYAKTSVGNQTIAAGNLSSDASAFTVAFTVAASPTPNPSTWAKAPFTVDTASITMTATTAKINGSSAGVQYYFHCLTTGGHDSGWQTNAAYTDTGLTPATMYAYQVKTRDGLTKTEGGYSAILSATTQRLANTRPTATVTAVPSLVAMPGGPNGLYSVPYQLVDAESGTCSVLVQYSADGGTTWRAATTYGSATTGLTSSAAGTAHTFVWDSLNDLGVVKSQNVKLRVTPTDAAAGIAGTSAGFSVDNTALTPRFSLTAPTSGTYGTGETIAIQWTATNVTAGSKISLCFDTDAVWGKGRENWIEIDAVAASNGAGSFNWDTSNVAPGTYYLAGYLWNGKNGFTMSHLTQAITIKSAPVFSLNNSAWGTYIVGQTVPIQWTAGNMPKGDKISLCLDSDTTLGNGNEKWIEIDQVTAVKGFGYYNWKSTGVTPGTYYIGGYMTDMKGTFTRSHAANPIVFVSAPQSFAIAGPQSQTIAAGQDLTIRWTAANVPSGSTISLCLDKDGTFNGNEMWLEIDSVAAANGTGSYTVPTGNLAAGTYYVAGYLYSGNNTFTLSHLTQPVTVTAPARTFALTGPTSGSYVAGQTVAINWTSGNLVPGSKVSLCYDNDTVWTGNNQHWIEIDQVTPDNGVGSYAWNTTGVAPGIYYVAGYLWDGKIGFTTSHLTQAITITAALTVDAAAAPQGSVAAITEAELAPIVAEAAKRWQAALGTQAAATLAAAKVELTDLPSGMLGEATNGEILIDPTADGYGWFVDATPGDDAEFGVAGAQTLPAAQGTDAADRADLLTAVMHEMGHLLGYADDFAGDLMNATLPLGTRRTV